MKNTKILFKFAKLGAIERLESLGAGIFLVIGLIIKMLLLVLFFDIIYSYVDEIAGWSRYEIFVLLGIYNLLETIGFATYIRGLRKVPNLILNGKMDVFITKPIDSRFFICCHRIDIIYSIPTLISSLAILFYGISGLETFYIWNFLFFLCLSFILHFSFFSILHSINFITLVRSSMFLSYELMSLGKYPISIFKGGFRLIFSTVIPIAILFSLPAKMLVELPSFSLLISVVTFVLIFYFISKLFWNFSIKFYESANG